MARFNNLLESKEINESNRQIAERVLLRGFLIDNLKYVTTEHKTIFGKSHNYYIFYDKQSMYSVFLGKTRFVFSGKDNDKQKEHS